MNDRLEIRKLLQNLLSNKDDGQGFADNDALISSGRLQSIDAVEVVMFLEENYSIDFAEHGFDQTELESVDSIMTLIGK